MPYSNNITAAARRPLDKTRLVMVPRTVAATVAHQALFKIQDERPEHMVAGVAVLFAAFCARCGLDPQEMHTLGNKMLRDQVGFRRDNDSLQSLRDFAGIRVMGEETVSIS